MFLNVPSKEIDLSEPKVKNPRFDIQPKKKEHKKEKKNNEKK